MSSSRGPLSEIAMKALSVVQARSITQGTSLFEELNKVGLIATEPRIREIQVSTLKNMYDRFCTMEPAELLRITRHGNSNPATPQDMWLSVVSWICTYIDYMEKE